MAENGLFGMQRLQRSLVHTKVAPESLGEGLWLDRIQPGGRDGPDRIVRSPWPGGRVWTDMFHFGKPEDPFMMTVPDIRLPANQYWPLHWHDCWIAVVVLEGTCLIGDWWMEPGDIMITAPGLEYGPLVIGPDGCQMFEIFAQLHLCGGGYSPEDRDHPTLVGGDHAFKERSALNKRNDGRSSLPCDGVEGLIKTRLAAGARWDLGDAGDPDRGIMGHTVVAPGEAVAAHHYGDWHGLFVLKGSLRLGDRELGANAVVIAEPGAVLPAIAGGPDGAEVFEVARTTAGWERLW